jgi:hypothetical protein
VRSQLLAALEDRVHLADNAQRVVARKPILLLASAVALLAVGGGCSGQGDDLGGSFVSFNTQDNDPDWSPTGRWVAFVSSRAGGGIYA